MLETRVGLLAIANVELLTAARLISGGYNGLLPLNTTFFRQAANFQISVLSGGTTAASVDTTNVAGPLTE